MSNPFRPVFLLVTMVLLVTSTAVLAQWNGEIVAWGDNRIRPVRRSHAKLWFHRSCRREACHSLGLKEDGSIVGWGVNDYGSASIPSPNTGFVAVAGGGDHSLGLKEDGSIVAWGWNPTMAVFHDLIQGFVAVAGGSFHSLGVEGKRLHRGVGGQRLRPVQCSISERGLLWRSQREACTALV